MLEKQKENQKNFNISESEEKILKFWQENKIFEKSLSKKLTKLKPKSFVFFDGPPFANGLPHYGHILASIIKDAIPRYQTMNGKKVPRKWGWDCHGLPVEYEIEKELNLKDKKAIEKFGIEKFSEAAKKNVLRYADEWKKIIPRIGRWADMENDYKTMDWTYMESVWWVFKSLFDKGLIYEGYKPMHLCPRCETTLANFEVSQGYKDITDISVIVKFELKPNQAIGNWMSSDKTYLLAWTTTPWTLPGNIALAVGEKIDYVKIKIEKDFYILAKERLNEVLKDKKYEIIEEFKGNELVGKKYKPLFDYYQHKSVLNQHQSALLENGWQIYGADFVQTEEGTGVVHIAPAFGENDMNLAQKHNLPFIQHISIDGKFKPEVRNFAGMSVKPKSDDEKIRFSADIAVIKYLQEHNAYFDKQKIVHSYPHCWRCGTPLLNYASSSWFVDIQAIKNKLIANNKKINWIPRHIKEGRFGKWLEEARDWAISRSRFWGAPLPVWSCQASADKRGLNAEQRRQSCGKKIVIGSIEEIKNNVKKSGNRYFAMRHGGAESNAHDIISSKIENSLNYPLTEKGKKDVEKTAEKLKEKKIDTIFSSDFLRTKQTAEIVAETIDYKKNKIIFDKRLREINTGVFDGRHHLEYHNYFSSLEEKFYKTPPEGENLTELKNRITEFLYEVERKYSNKNILIISHEYSIWCMFAGAIGANVKKAVEMKKNDDLIKTAEALEFDFTPMPHNKNFELDLHRPYIDEIKFDCQCGGKMKRIYDVFDCWFESGAMPYGQNHYPFENKKEFEKNFPAEFIAEGLDQTRGWFYTLLVLSTALFNKPAYKNVIVNGIILTEDGAKMSKRSKNYPDPMEIVKKYGADALRLYFLSSPAVAAEDLNFSEKGVDEVYKKTIMRLWNSFQFYEMYGKKITIAKGNFPPGFNQKSLLPTATSRQGLIKITNQNSKLNILDRWILARLNQLILRASEAMDNYELDKATRPIGEFVEDLSTWYVRRSRERFKNEGKDKQNASAVLGYVLLEFSKLIAPFMPFLSEKLYFSLNQNYNPKFKNYKSVHLEVWPKINKKAIDKKILEQMQEARKICSLGLEARQKAGIKVRQPLSGLRIKNYELRNERESLELIKNEVNVKKIVFDKNIASDVELDAKITPELKTEGQLREFTRAIQDLRKDNGFKPDQKDILQQIQTDENGKNLIVKNEFEFKKATGTAIIEFVDLNNGKEIEIDGMKFKVVIKK